MAVTEKFLTPQDRLRRRTRLRISRERLSLELGTHDQTIRRLELGIKRTPPDGYETLDEFWAAYDRALDRLRDELLADE